MAERCIGGLTKKRLRAAMNIYATSVKSRERSNDRVVVTFFFFFLKGDVEWVSLSKYFSVPPL